MAGRYSKEYRPNEFVKLPFEEIAKVMAMKEQQYQQGYLQPAAYQQKMGELEVRTPDIEYHQKLINDATNKARQLAEETYGGDYGAAASDITRTLANEASNPFYGWTKSKMDEYKKAKDIEMKLKAEGKYIGFDEGLLNTAYYDKENNKYNTNLTTNLQEKLDYEKQRQDIWNYAIQEEGGSYKGKLANAETEAKAGRLFLEIPKTSWQGVNDTQITNKFKGALAQYMSTAEYDQEKALLKKNGFDDKQADIKIADDMLKSGLLKKHMITKDDSQILNNPLGKANGGGGGNKLNVPPEPTDEPTSEETTNRGEKAKNNIIKNKDNFIKKMSIQSPEYIKLQGEYANLINKGGGVGNDQIKLNELKQKMVTIESASKDLLKVPISKLSKFDINNLFSSGDLIQTSKSFNPLKKYTKTVENLIKSTPSATMDDVFNIIGDIEAQRDGRRNTTYTINSDSANKTIKEIATRGGFPADENSTFKISDNGNVILYDKKGVATLVPRSIGKFTNPQTMLLQSLESVSNINNEYSSQYGVGADERVIKTKGLYIDGKQYNVSIIPGTNVAELVDPVTSKKINYTMSVPTLKQYLVDAFISTLKREE